MQEHLNRKGLRTQPPAADAAEEIRSPAIAEGWGGYLPTGVIKIVKFWVVQIGLQAHSMGVWASTGGDGRRLSMVMVGR
jgi:hypothetical protein